VHTLHSALSTASVAISTGTAILQVTTALMWVSSTRFPFWSEGLKSLNRVASVSTDACPMNTLPSTASLFRCKRSTYTSSDCDDKYHNHVCGPNYASFRRSAAQAATIVLALIHSRHRLGRPSESAAKTYLRGGYGFRRLPCTGLLSKTYLFKANVFFWGTVGLIYTSPQKPLNEAGKHL
jgi:hypothetical protein